jgi:hypothetical protein
MEIWKQIDNYPNYEISNMGNIRNKKNNRILKQKLQNGYCCITLPPLKKGFKIHRLVANAFILNPKNKSQVHHINNIKNDNKVENLEWVTNGENQRYRPSCKRKIPYDFLLEFYLKHK